MRPHRDKKEKDMSIKDRNAKVENRKFIDSTQTAETTRGVSATKGVPEESVFGGVRQVQANSFSMPGAGDDILREPVKSVCTGITKKGLACTASPIRGEDLCIGHSRQ